MRMGGQFHAGQRLQGLTVDTVLVFAHGGSGQE